MSTTAQAEQTKEALIAEVMELPQEIRDCSENELTNRLRMLDNNMRVMRGELMSLQHETAAMNEKINDNKEKIKMNKQLPYLVSNIVEILDSNAERNEDGASMDVDSQRTGKCAVVRTSTRITTFLPVIGLVDSSELKPGDLVGCHKDSFLVLEKLPTEYDSRVKAMEVDEKPVEDYNDIGGLDKQIEELVEAIVLPMTHHEKFKTLGIKAPKGVLMYGPPGTGN